MVAQLHGSASTPIRPNYTNWTTVEAVKSRRCLMSIKKNCNTVSGCEGSPISGYIYIFNIYNITMPQEITLKPKGGFVSVSRQTWTRKNQNFR